MTEARETATTDEPDGPLNGPEINPLSVQAASLVRSIDALSNIFWICLVGFFLSIFFTGLAGLEDNANTDSIFLGEYQVPKNILPLASLSFAIFAFWLVSNRLKMLVYVLSTTTLSTTLVHEIFKLNPPVFHIFDKDNAQPWSLFSGVSVFILIWSVFFGNAIALTWGSVGQQIATLAEFDPVLLVFYGFAIIGVIVYGARSITPPLRSILANLHQTTFRIGWQRHTLAGLTVIAALGVNQWSQFSSIVDQPDDLLGPAYANAIDGETLYMNGLEVSLFGIDAVENGQMCNDAQGQPYSCGQLATNALQEMVQEAMVVCFPLFAVNSQRVLAVCELADADSPPVRSNDFIEGYRENNLSRLMVVQGHALAVGLGLQVYHDEQLQAQTLRQGIWQGSFMPPRLWRRSQR